MCCPKPLPAADLRAIRRAITQWERSLDRAEPMTQAAFARSRGLSRQYIGRCVESGILRRAVVTVGGRRLLDPVVADRELDENRPGQLRVDRP